jgi:hypothetical protein
MNRTRAPLRYLPWFGRDTLAFPFSIFLLAAVGMGFLFWRLASKFHTGPATGTVAHQIQVGVWSTCLTVAVLMATAGVVGQDLQRGYYRAWFSKPMAAWWFYLQRFILGAATVLVAPYLLGLAIKLALGGDFGIDGPLMANIALGVLLIGGATVLLSVFTTRGWLLVYLMVIVQTIVGGLMVRFNAQSGVSMPGFFVWLHRLLPPFDLVDLKQPVASGSDLVHVLGYGGAMVVLAFTLLKWRPLGSGGRA